MLNGETPEVEIRLTIPGDHEALRISDVTTADGPRALVEIVSGGGKMPVVLASATFDTEQARHIGDAFLLLISQSMKPNDQEIRHDH